MVVREFDDIVGGNLSMTGADSVTLTVRLLGVVPKTLLTEMVSAYATFLNLPLITRELPLTVADDCGLVTSV